jgi:hypothetical protein
MRRSGLFLTMASAALLSGALIIGTTAWAASGSQRECEAGGGTYTKDGPNSICVYPETTKDVPGNAFGTATQDTTTGQGNLGNKTKNECTGNQGQCKQ